VRIRTHLLADGDGAFLEELLLPDVGRDEAAAKEERGEEGALTKIGLGGGAKSAKVRTNEAAFPFGRGKRLAKSWWGRGRNGGESGVLLLLRVDDGDGDDEGGERGRRRREEINLSDGLLPLLRPLFR